MSYTHSIMFHHFHGGRHHRSQGSLSGDDFSRMIDWLDRRHNLIGARAYCDKFENGRLAPSEICLSFDDALLCQFDIAAPILNDRGIDAFFFIYSSVFSGEPDYLEVFRYFRTNNFESLDEFYESFFSEVFLTFSEEFQTHAEIYPNLNYLSEFPFYTKNDRWFRYLRDNLLGPDRYKNIMKMMMKGRGFSAHEVLGDLWMSEDNVKQLAASGHVIGLHSFSHPMQMSTLSLDEQRNEYLTNYQHLQGLVGNITSMSHPCGDYNSDTLDLLDDMGIRIGFRSSLSTTEITGRFEIPREDHSNILKAMNE